MAVTKAQLRNQLCCQRENLPQEVQRHCAEQLAQHFVSHPAFMQSQHIACYWACQGELSLESLVQHAEHFGKQCYLPVVGANPSEPMQFFSYEWGQDLQENCYGILEPMPQHATAITPEALDLVLLPLVGFDEQGNRLGRGAGHYDYTFAFKQQHDKLASPCLLGVAYEFQRLPQVPAERWDVPLQGVVTETQVYLSNPLSK